MTDDVIVITCHKIQILNNSSNMMSIKDNYYIGRILYHGIKMSFRCEILIDPAMNLKDCRLSQLR